MWEMQEFKHKKDAFFICADDEKGGLITLDSIPPVMVYRIPASYKPAYGTNWIKRRRLTCVPFIRRCRLVGHI